VQSLIRNEERAKQLINFAGLRYGTGYPTDIDGMIEYHDKCYIFYEGKHVKATMTLGQRLALERVCDDLKTLKPTMVVCFVHDTPTDQQIDISACKVKSCRWMGKWVDVKADITVKRLTDWFIKKYGEGYSEKEKELIK
jgi:hypothetical protein